MEPNTLLFNLFWIFIYLIVLFGVFGGGITWLIRKKKRKNREKTQYDLTFMQIKMPQQDETEIEAMEHLYNSLVGLKKGGFSLFGGNENCISFEIISKKDGIGFYMVVPDKYVSYIEKQINGTYPNAEIDLIDPNEIWDRGAFTALKELQTTGEVFYPINTYKQAGDTDALNGITSAMSKLKNDEVLAVQILISPAGTAWQTAGRSYISRLKNAGAEEGKSHTVDTSMIEGIEQKISKQGFEVKVRLLAIAHDSTTAYANLEGLNNAFEQFTSVKFSSFRSTTPMFLKSAIEDFIYRRMSKVNIKIPVFEFTIKRNFSVLNTEELATLFHFPTQKVKTPNIKWLISRKGPAPANVPQEGLYLGENIYRGVTTKVYMKPVDRTRHLYIIGQTGTGKSVFMSSLTLQDIYNGDGVAYIDPHGSEIDKLLEEMPEHRMDDVILFDPSDDQMPMGLNILETVTGAEEEKNMIVNAFIDLLYKLYDPNRQGIIGPKLERAVRNVMLTAMYDKDSTMVDVLRLLIDADYQKKYMPLIKDPLVMKYWTDEVAKTSDFHKSETMGYFVSKFDRFVTERLMRNIIGQPRSAFNIADVMANKKILLINLSKGKIGEANSTFLGLILVPRIVSAALARAKIIGKEEFPDFYLYVDEFQNFATPDFATILSEARKYKLNLTVAHQFIAQLDEEIKEAIFGNVGSMCVFRISPEDAEFVLPQFEPQFNVNDIIRNPIGNGYIKLLVDGYPSQPFSLRVDYERIVSMPKSKERAEQLVQMSRQRYGNPVAQVEEYINERAGLVQKQEEKPAPRRLVPF